MKTRANILLVLFLGMLSGCDKGFEELNTNPNQPTIANPDQLFTEAMVISAGQFSTGIHTEIWSLEVWNQQMASITGVSSASDPYAYSADWNDELWMEWYTRILAPLNEVVKLTADDPYLINKHSIARIMRAHTFHRITDLWGDIPYSEAILGINPDGEPILMPVYDAQEDVYADLLNELKTAVAALDASQGEYGAADLLYGGSIDKWTRFGNTLRLRLAIRISGANATLAQEHITELMSNEANLMQSNADGAHFIFVPGNHSPMYDLENSGQGMRNPSHFVVELLKSSQDPRVAIYCEETPQSQVLGTDPYVGVPNLLNSVDLNALSISEFSTSYAGSSWLQVGSPGTTMSYAEACFLKAEVALNGWGGALSAQGYYDEGVRAAMEFVGVADTSIINYLAGAGAFDGTLENIITQKYITLVYRDGYEAFAELRRTGFPILTDVNNAPISMANFPQRLEYPPSEINLNGSNVNAVGEGIGENSTPVWWGQ
jgi:hypothetical protein